MTFGSEVFRGFNTNGLYFFHEPNGALSLWVTACNVPWFPSVLQELSPRGEVLSEYWSNGHVTTLRSLALQGRSYLLLGGYNNERHGASLAILDRAHATGTAPAENPKYRCVDCADGEPAEFLVFPGSDIMKEATAGEGSAVVSDARLLGQDELVVTVHQMSTRVPGQADPLEASLNYTLSTKDLSLRRLVLLWGYQMIHKSFERVGRMDHAAASDEEAELSRVLRWSHGRFMPLTEASGDPVFARTRGGTGGVGGANQTPSAPRCPLDTSVIPAEHSLSRQRPRGHRAHAVSSTTRTPSTKRSWTSSPRSDSTLIHSAPNRSSPRRPCFRPSLLKRCWPESSDWASSQLMRPKTGCCERWPFWVLSWSENANNRAP